MRDAIAILLVVGFVAVAVLVVYACGLLFAGEDPLQQRER